MVGGLGLHLSLIKYVGHHALGSTEFLEGAHELEGETRIVSGEDEGKVWGRGSILEDGGLCQVCLLESTPHPQCLAHNRDAEVKYLTLAAGRICRV